MGYEEIQNYLKNLPKKENVYSKEIEGYLKTLPQTVQEPQKKQGGFFGFLSGRKEEAKSIARESLKLLPKIGLTGTEVAGGALEASEKPYTLKDFASDALRPPPFYDLGKTASNLSRGSTLIQRGLVERGKQLISPFEIPEGTGKAIKEKSRELKGGLDTFLDEKLPVLKPSEQEKELISEPIDFGKLAQEAMSLKPGRESDKSASKLAANLPSFLAALGTFALTKNPTAGAALLGIAEGADTGEAAEKAGVPVEDAQNLQLLEIVGNTLLERWGLEQIGMPLMRGSTMTVKRLGDNIMKKVGKTAFLKNLTGGVQQAAKNFFTEAGQEGTQQVFSNMVEKFGWNSTKSLIEGLGESMYIGGLLGGGAGGVSGSIAASKQNRMLKIDQIREEARKMGATPKQFKQLVDYISATMAAKAAGADKAEMTKILEEAVNTNIGKQTQKQTDEERVTQIEEFTGLQEREAVAAETLKKSGLEKGAKEEFKEETALPKDAGELGQDFQAKARLKAIETELGELNKKISPQQEESLAAGEPAGLEAEARKFKTAEEFVKSEEIVVANEGADGKIYYGNTNELHFSLSERHSDAIRKKANLKAGEPTWKKQGFAKRGGEIMTREEALKSQPFIKPTLKKEGQLDAADYREQVKNKLTNIWNKAQQQRPTKTEKSDAQLQKLQDQKDALTEEKNSLLAVTDTIEGLKLDEMEFSDVELEVEIRKQLRNHLLNARRAGVTLGRDLAALAKTKLLTITGLKRIPVTNVDPDTKQQINWLKQQASATSSYEKLTALYFEAVALRKRSEIDIIHTQEARRELESAEAATIVGLLHAQYKTQDPEIKLNFAQKTAQFSNARLLEPARLFDKIDGGRATFDGAAHDVGFNQIRKAENSTLDNTERYITEVEILAEDAGFTPERQMQKVDIQGSEFTISEIAQVWAVRQNKENIAAIVFGNGIDVGMIQEMFTQLTKEEKAGVDAIVDKLMDRYPAIRETYIRQHDGKKDLTKVNRGFFPMRRLGLGQKTYEDELGVEFEQRRELNRAFIRDKFLNRRVRIKPENQKRIRLGFFEELNGHIRKREQFIGMSGAIRHASNVFNNAEVKETIGAIPQLGDSVNKVISDYLGIWANNGRFLQQNIEDNFISALKSHAAIAYLGFNLTTMSIQSQSIWLALGNGLGFHDIASGIGQSFGATAVKIGTLGKDQTLTDFIRLNSPLMRNRSVERELLFIQRNQPTAYKRMVRNIGHAGMWGIMKIDQMTVEAMWKAKYDKVDKIHGHERAVQEADNLISRTQPAARLSDRPAIMDGWFKVFTSFMSQTSKVYGIGNDALSRMQTGQKSKGLMTAVGVGMMAYLVWAIRNQKPYPENWEEITILATSPLAYVPVVGAMATQTIAGYDAGVPALDVVVNAAEFFTGGGSLDRKAKQAAELIGLGAGLPVRGTIKTIKQAVSLTEWLGMTDKQKAALKRKEKSEEARKLASAKSSLRSAKFKVENSKDPALLKAAQQTLLELGFLTRANKRD